MSISQSLLQKGTGITSWQTPVVIFHQSTVLPLTVWQTMHEYVYGSLNV